MVYSLRLMTFRIFSFWCVFFFNIPWKCAYEYRHVPKILLILGNQYQPIREFWKRSDLIWLRFDEYQKPKFCCMFSQFVHTHAYVKIPICMPQNNINPTQKTNLNLC